MAPRLEARADREDQPSMARPLRGLPQSTAANFPQFLTPPPVIPGRRSRTRNPGANDRCLSPLDSGSTRCVSRNDDDSPNLHRTHRFREVAQIAGDDAAVATLPALGIIDAHAALVREAMEDVV